MTKRIKKTVVEIPEPIVTVPEFIANAAKARKAIEFGYTDKQGVSSRRVCVPIKFVGTKAVMASLFRDGGDIRMQGGNRNFEVSRISNPRLYVPTAAERPVAELGWARVKGLFAAMDAAKNASAQAAENANSARTS